MRRRSYINHDEARRAIEQAQQERKEAEARDPYIEWLTGRLRSHRMDNHFSDLLWEAMRRKHT